MEKLKRKKLTICIFIFPALICYIFITLFPMLCSTLLSFADWDVAGLNKFVGIDNYIKMFTADNIFKKAVLNTFLITFLCLLFQIPSALFLAYQLTKTKRGKDFFKVTYFVPNVLSTAAIGLMWSFIFHPQIGLVNGALKSFGLQTYTWLGDKKTALLCVCIAIAWQCIGYHMIIHLTAMQDISSSVLESAKIDGATSWQAFKHIIFPLIIPILKVDTVMVATGSLKCFDMIYIMTGGGPNHYSEVLALHMYTRAFKGLQFGYGSALAVILMIICIIITILINKIFRRGEINIE